jgi:hypothetical protein
MLGAGNFDPDMLERGPRSIEHRVVSAVGGAGKIISVQKDTG